MRPLLKGARDVCLRGANGPPRRDSYHLYLGGQECGRNGCGLPLLVLLVTDCFGRGGFRVGNSVCQFLSLF